MSITIQQKLRWVALFSMLSATVLSLNIATIAQEKSRRQTEPQKINQAMGHSATLTAALIDAEKNATQKTATVQVKVTGVNLIDPAMSNKRPTKGQGHLHYQIDGGPVIATTTPKLSFHELTPGKHAIVVMLANNDHSPAGPQQTLEVTVP
jgi:hypothetical protein